ncbi:MAG: hypothetical protein WKG07_27525 [Hymenobacter sp.]
MLALGGCATTGPLTTSTETDGVYYSSKDRTTALGATAGRRWLHAVQRPPLTAPRWLLPLPLPTMPTRIIRAGNRLRPRAARTTTAAITRSPITVTALQPAL